MNPTPKQFERALRDFMRVAGTSCQLTLDWPHMVGIIASLQLSLRHPLNVGPTAAQIRMFLDDIINSIGKRSPDFADMLRLGDDPNKDVIITKPSGK